MDLLLQTSDDERDARNAPDHSSTAATAATSVTSPSLDNSDCSQFDEAQIIREARQLKTPPSEMDSTDITDAEGVGKAPEDVVIPPKETRRVIETVASYVARNGIAFEDRVKDKPGSNKFAFISKTDAFHTYYAWRLKENQAGRGTATTGGASGQGPASNEPPKPKGPKEPPQFQFSVPMPPNITAQDLDVVRLTAVFVAKNGRSFMTQLSQRESQNPQFDFLRPQHSFNQFFNQMVDQYSRIVNESAQDVEAKMAELTDNIKNKFSLLDRARERAEWTKHQESQKKKQNDDAEAERLAYAQIDWHDFVIVETVVFDEADDQVELPPPVNLSDLQSMSLEQKSRVSLAPHNMRIEEAVPFDESLYNAYPPQQPQAPYRAPSQATGPGMAPPSSLPARPPSLPAPGPSMSPQPPMPGVQAPVQQPARPSSTTPASAPMKIRSDYVPRAAAARASNSSTHAICPNCMQPVPMAELQEHMRIELLDPQWKEQRAKADSRYATTNLSTAEVARNLKRLASQRTDVFDQGVVGGDGAGVEREPKRVMGNAGPDGSLQGQPVDIAAQLRRIQEKAAGSRD